MISYTIVVLCVYNLLSGTTWMLWQYGYFLRCLSLLLYCQKTKQSISYNISSKTHNLYWRLCILKEANNFFFYLFLNYIYYISHFRYGGNAKVVHFLGKTKPWSCTFDSKSKQVVGSVHEATTHPSFLLDWWILYSSAVVPMLQEQYGDKPFHSGVVEVNQHHICLAAPVLHIYHTQLCQNSQIVWFFFSLDLPFYNVTFIWLASNKIAVYILLYINMLSNSVIQSKRISLPLIV